MMSESRVTSIFSPQVVISLTILQYEALYAWVIRLVSQVSKCLLADFSPNLNESEMIFHGTVETLTSSIFSSTSCKLSEVGCLCPKSEPSQCSCFLSSVLHRLWFVREASTPLLRDKQHYFINTYSRNIVQLHLNRRPHYILKYL